MGLIDLLLLFTRLDQLQTLPGRKDIHLAAPFFCLRATYKCHQRHGSRDHVFRSDQQGINIATLGEPFPIISSGRGRGTPIKQGDEGRLLALGPLYWMRYPPLVSLFFFYFSFF